MKLSGAGPVFKGEIFCGEPDSVVNSELVREAEIVLRILPFFCFVFVYFRTRILSRLEYF